MAGRRRAGLTLQALAAAVRKDDGTPISLTYLSDVEHDRRLPPSPRLMRQIAQAAGLSDSICSSSPARCPRIYVRVIPRQRPWKRRFGPSVRRWLRMPACTQRGPGLVRVDAGDNRVFDLLT
jgi:transcriptional regulator with XRE-family HTH domain